MPSPGGPGGYLSTLPPQEVRPGLGGMNRNEVADPNQAALIQNLELRADGIWRPRPGLVEVYAASANFQHISDHTDGLHVMIVEGGRLQHVTTAGFATQLATGWTSTGFYKSATGIASGTAPPDWCIPSTNVNNATPAQLYKVNSSGTLAAMSTATGNWLEAYGQYAFAVKPGSLNWSAAEDITTWSGTNTEPPNPAVGKISAFVALSDNQAIILGNKGCSLWFGAGSFSQQQLYNVRAIPYGLHAVRCGGSVLFASPGPQILEFKGANNLARVDEPIYGDLKNILDWNDVVCWYDPFRNEYVISDHDATNGKVTYHYDMTRRVWSAKNIYKNGGGSAGQAIGQAVVVTTGGDDFARYIGVDNKLMLLSETTYTDDGDAISCILETAPDDRGLPGVYKVMQRVYVQCQGAWSATLYYRDRPGASWSTSAGLNTVSGPGWIEFNVNVEYVERKIRLTATAASGVSLAKIVVLESTAMGWVS